MPASASRPPPCLPQLAAQGAAPSPQKAANVTCNDDPLGIGSAGSVSFQVLKVPKAPEPEQRHTAEGTSSEATKPARRGGGSRGGGGGRRGSKSSGNGAAEASTANA
eukprot:2423847-Lingulodinium_polyedra.AAC.1